MSSAHTVEHPEPAEQQPEPPLQIGAPQLVWIAVAAIAATAIHTSWVTPN